MVINIFGHGGPPIFAFGKFQGLSVLKEAGEVWAHESSLLLRIGGTNALSGYALSLAQHVESYDAIWS